MQSYLSKENTSRNQKSSQSKKRRRQESDDRASDNVYYEWDKEVEELVQIKSKNKKKQQKYTRQSRNNIYN